MSFSLTKCGYKTAFDIGSANLCFLGRLIETILMEQHVFSFSLIIEGTTGKVLQFKMPVRSIYSKNLGFSEKNVILRTTERFKQ